MRKLVLMNSLACVSLSLFAQVPKFSPEFQAIYDAATAPEVQKAVRRGAKAKLIYHIVDDEGVPISNVMVYGQWQNNFPRKIWKETFITDASGTFVAKEKVGGNFAFSIKKEGYYLSSTGLDFHWRAGVSPLVKDGKWQPYGEERTLVVKRKKNPVEMVSHHFARIVAPATNVWLGFDMELFKWTQPYGDGKHNDIFLRFNYERCDKYAVKWAMLDVSFTNNQYDGFYVIPKDEYSEMKSPYHANTNAVFSQTHTFRKEYFEKYPDTVGAGDCMVFRIRTRTDEKGNLVSANYGKIYGLWEFAKFMEIRDIYINPNPNDTNLEDMETFKKSEERWNRWGR